MKSILASTLTPLKRIDSDILKSKFSIYFILIISIASIIWITTRLHRSHKHKKAELATKKAIHQQRISQSASHENDRHLKDYTLEIYGVGLSIEELKCESIWSTISKSDFHTLITPDNFDNHPWNGNRKGELAGLRHSTALNSAFSHLGWKWICPLIAANPPNNNPFKKTDSDLRKIHTDASFHAWTCVKARDEEVPDEVWDDAFDIFLANPDLPLCAIESGDGVVTRNDQCHPGSLTDEQRKHLPPGLQFAQNLDGDMPPGYLRDAYTFFALGRRDRVDALRPYAFSINPNLYPHPTEELYESDADGARMHDVPVRPTVPLPPLPGSAEEKAVVASFKPTKWFRRPWAKFQIAQFDARPLMARIHRPQRVEYRDASGRRLTTKERSQAFLEAWKRALAALPEGQKPVRLIYDAGGPSKASHLVPLSHALHEAGPDLEIMGKEAVDLTTRFGNTGASSPFVAVALGVYASYQDGGVSACISLRADDHATILMVSPPNAEDKARNAKVHPWNPAEWIPEEGNGLVEPEWLKKQSSRLPLGTERPSNSRCPEPGLWQCAHAKHADGRLRHFSQDEWFPEALLLRRRFLWRKEELLDTTWTLIAYPDPQGGIGPEETSHG